MALHSARYYTFDTPQRHTSLYNTCNTRLHCTTLYSPCVRHIGIAEVPPARALHRHRHPPRGRGRGGVLHDEQVRQSLCVSLSVFLFISALLAQLYFSLLLFLVIPLDYHLSISITPRSPFIPFSVYYSYSLSRLLSYSVPLPHLVSSPVPFRYPISSPVPFRYPISSPVPFRYPISSPLICRVMTASFHKFGEYFPGTGDVKDKVGGTVRCSGVC
jgi:hypothetical protein